MELSNIIAIAGFVLSLVVYVVSIMMVFSRQRSQNEKIEAEQLRFVALLKQMQDEHSTLRDEVHKEYITDERYREDLQRIWNRMEDLSKDVNALGLTLERELRGFAETLTAELSKMIASK
jgi:uncharacterized protein YlxW (UPF0749 family)